MLRTARSVVVTAVSCLALAGCTTSGTPTRASGSSTPTSTSSGPQRLTPADKDFLRRDLLAVHGLYSASLIACPPGVAYTDTKCGAQLRSVGAYADDVADLTAGYASDGETRKIVGAAQDVTKAVQVISDLGCFGLRGNGKKESAGTLKGLCPSTASIAQLSFLALQSYLSS